MSNSNYTSREARRNAEMNKLLGMKDGIDPVSDAIRATNDAHQAVVLGHVDRDPLRKRLERASREQNAEPDEEINRGEMRGLLRYAQGRHFNPENLGNNQVRFTMDGYAVTLRLTDKAIAMLDGKGYFRDDALRTNTGLAQSDKLEGIVPPATMNEIRQAVNDYSASGTAMQAPERTQKGMQL